MPEVPTLAIGFRIPVIRQLKLRIVVWVTGRSEVEQRVAPLRILHAPHLSEAELVAVEIERAIDVADAHHGVEILHDKPLAGSCRNARSPLAPRCMP